MPANLPSSFASAAAGQNTNRDSRNSRGDGRGSVGADWSRRDGRSANGTLTFRRSSTTPLGHPSSQPPPLDNTAMSNSETVETPVAQPSNYDLGPARYGKEDLLDKFRPQRTEDPSRLFFSGWNPGQVNGGSTRGWGKSSDNHIPQEPGACWDQNGESIPMGLHDFSSEEKEAFSSEINSPLKPPTMTKEPQQGNVNGRKASLSHGVANAYGVSSPSSATRPGTRRRDTTEPNPFSTIGMTSPTANRFSRDDPSYWFPRKGGEPKEHEREELEPEQGSRADPPNKLPFGNLIRSNTSGSIGAGSGWPPSSQVTTPSATTGGGFGNFALPSSAAIGDKRTSGPPGGSRLAHLMPKDGPDPSGRSGEVPNPLNQQSWRSRPRTDTDPFGENAPSGSAALGGAQDTSPTAPQQGGRIGALGTPVKGSTGDFGMSGLNLGGGHDENGPLSPSETNPFRSPQAEHDDGDPGVHDRGQLGQYDQPPPNYSSIPRGFAASALEESDRSQTSSVGAKAYPLNPISGWPAPNPAVGTPDRERPNFGGAFGNSLFNPLGGDMQSPGLSNLGNMFGPASAGLGTGSIGRGSKLGSLFPASMQAQMQNNEQEISLGDSVPDLRQNNPLGAIGRNNNFVNPSRDTESPMRSNRGVFEELFPTSDSRAQSVFGNETGVPVTGPSYTPVGGGPFGNAQPGAEPPSALRQMVMPDRMRWVYLDPQGQVQGPFTGLEMNDWYKANFFTPDLRVKKIEDPEFEPLGQLIRRIGNSREPFLVPQIGIPHGPAAQGGSFPPANNSGVVPPLSGVFPSFGRTLTAEEQNNLERRKQEEQFIVAQQREFMMRQQSMPRLPMQPGLQHQGSAQSLQSQPSFGSMTSPIGMSQQQPIGAMPPAGFFEGAPGQPTSRAGAGNGELYGDDERNTYSTSERQLLAFLSEGGPNEASLRAGLPGITQLGDDPEGFRERLKEFQDLRAQHEAEQAAKAVEGEHYVESEFSAAPQQPDQNAELPGPSGKSKGSKTKRMEDYEAALSLTQQVQAAQAVAAAGSQPPKPGMPMPFPPPSSTTPLPAPTAQRVRSNLPEQYSRSQNGTPDAGSVTAPSLAPWAKDHGHESSKGPSLKEIQEAEARKAARAEEAAASLRKAAMEQEAAIIREKEKAAAIASAAGLPASSTWGHGSPVSAASPWSKPTPVKTAAPGLSSVSAAAANKKTLADIQREEENRKMKAAKDVTIQPGLAAVVSKSYANLAGKPGQPGMPNAPSPAAGAAPAAGWATVGAGGKVRVPTGPTGQGRSVSAASVKPVVAPVKIVSRPAANGKTDAGATAMDEFNKWVHRELSRGITGVNDIASFQAALDVLPLDTGLIADAVYANSTTMDGRHFAEEFVRRKRLAEKGVVERQPSTDGKTASSASGWSEVAKKGGSAAAAPGASPAPQEGPAPGFKVVPGRKKGKK